METNEKKVVLITGCSSGFGLRIAAHLASRGYQVFATMRNLDKSQDLLNEVAQRGGQVDLLKLDVIDRESIQNAIQEIKNRAGRIDVLINNAGYGIGGFFEDLTQEEIRAQMETNFFGVQNVTRQVIPLMRDQKSGRIINISSISGLYALPAFGAYNASKWALEGFSESLYYELKPFGINVCLIEPGIYRTKIFSENRKEAKRFFDSSSPYYERSQYFKKKVKENATQDKKNPEEIAVLVEHLIKSSNPTFRNIPDRKSRILCLLRRFLPFRLYSSLLYKAFYADMHKN